MLSFLKTIRTSDIPRSYYDGVRVNGTDVAIVPQRVRFGHKRLFLCPRCGARREKLLMDERGRLCCRGCCPVDPYADRRNLYDEGGTALIVWHMRRIADGVGITIRFPFRYHAHMDAMMAQPLRREARFRKALYQLQMLEALRYNVLAHGHRYSASDIREYISGDIEEMFTLDELIVPRVSFS